METAPDDDFLEDERLRMLFDTIAEVNSTLELEELLVRVVDRALDLTGAERGILILKDEDGEGRVRVARDQERQDLPLPVEYSRQVAHTVLDEGVAEVHEIDLSESGEYPLTDSIMSLGLRTVMCVPQRLGKETTGVLYVDSRVGASVQFRESDLRLFGALADQAAIAIENARLRETELVKAGLEERMRVAGEIQQGLFPPCSLQLPGYDIFGVSHPCQQTGGDYFDYIPGRDGRTGIVLGDVSGHSLESALYMLTARAHFLSTLKWEEDLVKAFRHLNRVLERDMELGYFMSFLHVDLDTVGRSFRYVNAGHEPPRILRAGREEFEELPLHGAAFAFLPDPSYRISEPARIEPGDLLLLVTDGIPEARRPGPKDSHREIFGIDRLEQVVRERRDRPSAEIVGAVIESVGEYIEGGTVEDDLTIVVVRATE
jgi:sigma-B regulation protein RsbU (phosphoserine phosphatase)